MSRMPEPRELDPVAAGLIRVAMTGDKFATDRNLTRAVEADLDGLFFAFTMANLAGRVLAYACGGEAQAVALLDNLIDGLVQERARAAALQLKLGFVLGLCPLPGGGACPAGVLLAQRRGCAGARRPSWRASQGSGLAAMRSPRARARSSRAAASSRGAGQSSQMSPVTVIVANPCSRLAVPVIVVILLSW